MSSTPEITGRKTYANDRDAANPWGLTARQLEVVRALVTLHYIKRVASKLNVETCTISGNLKAIHKAMKCHNNIAVCVTFDRWDRQA